MTVYQKPVRQPQFRLMRMCVLAAIIGVLAGIAAEILDGMIGLVTNAAFYQRLSTELISPLGSHSPLLLVFVPAVGGLIIGLMAKYGTPLVRGHGIPEAMEAVLVKKSRISPRVAVLKPLSAAISIGSGQPFGAEGPIIQTGGAIGSLLGQMVHTTAAERKVLLACGASAGLAAIFGTPIAAMIFAIEILLFEFRARSFIPLAIANVVAAEAHIVLISSQPVFEVGAVNFGSPLELMMFLCLGLIAGLVSAGIIRGLYWVEDRFHHSRINTYLWPALGGLFVGVVGYIVPTYIIPGVDIYGPGYKVISGILNGNYVLTFLIALFLAKSAVWLVSVGSGTSGGTLAPIFMIGAALGGIFGLIMQSLFPGMTAAPVAFAMAGMAAVFAGTTRATFASIIFVFEMTQDYHALLPVMIATVVTTAIASRLMKTSVLTEQLRRAGVMVSHDYEADVLKTLPVSAVMTTDPVMVPQDMTVRQLMEKVNLNDPAMIRHQAMLIVDPEQGNCLRGIVTRGDLLKALQKGSTDDTVLEAGSTDVSVAYPDDSVRDALTRMLQRDIGRLPVVDCDDPSKIVGYLSRGNVISAHLKQLAEESELDAGWLQNRILTTFSRR
ncbi:MAG: CBS domain-containing protein [Chloroflexi bacterium]|nr:CBS domain-containing protein [Chloroflexota bacterium]